MDQTVISNPTSSADIDIGEWYSVVPFASVRWFHHIVISYQSVQPFNQQKTWPAHRFYVDIYQSENENLKQRKNENTLAKELFHDSYME